MSYLQAIFLGLVQGIAEFLPISSSGHLLLFQTFFQMENYEETHMLFSVLLHFGTLVAVCVYYWRDILEMIREFFRGVKSLVKPASEKDSVPPPPARRLVMLIVVATLPLFLILPVKKLMESVFYNNIAVSIALLVTGCLLFFSDRLARGRKSAKNATVLDAILVGVAQAIGTIPGISRSGITISAGLMRGFDRKFAVRFSFLMSLPAVLGATILEVADAVGTGVDSGLIPMYAVGVVVSGVVGYFAIRLVNLLSDKGKFGMFSYYCWVVGLGSLIAGLVVPIFN